MHETDLRRNAPLRSDRCCLNEDGPRPSQRELCMVCKVKLCEHAVVSRVHAHGADDDAVVERQAPDLEGVEEGGHLQSKKQWLFLFFSPLMVCRKKFQVNEAVTKDPGSSAFRTDIKGHMI